MSTLEKAIEIAAKAHAGMVDKAGAPYILHPLRVMLDQKNNDARIIAVLHDIVEDTDWTLQDLREEGFSEVAINGIAAVTRNEHESYEAFVERAGADPLGYVVKLADLKDNMDLSRIENPSDKDFKRIEKYKRATKKLLSMSSTVPFDSKDI